MEINNFGIFRQGLTSDEIKEYLTSLVGKKEIKKFLKKFDEELGAVTCPVIRFDGKEIVLFYRHDVENVVNFLLKGKEYLFD